MNSVKEAIAFLRKSNFDDAKEIANKLEKDFKSLDIVSKLLKEHNEILKDILAQTKQLKNTLVMDLVDKRVPDKKWQKYH